MQGHEEITGEDQAANDVVDIAAQAGQFNTLVEAVKAAGLVETLRGEGPLTVFAPTDEAFAKIPADTLQAVLNNREQLTAILTYHVVPGKLMASDVVRSSQLQTVQGQSITVSTEGGVRVDDANVIQTDIEADNGVIHVIDSVLMP